MPPKKKIIEETDSAKVVDTPKPRKKKKEEDMIEEDAKPKSKSKPKKSAKNVKAVKEVVNVPASDRIYSGKQVIIVESPNKIKKIKEILAKVKQLPNFENCDFDVTASMGHIREIDKKNVGISLETFEPNYMISDSKVNVVADLRDCVSDANMVWLAADADREGESIAWHCMEVLRLKDEDYNRITFNEITEKAIKEALLHPRKVDMDMYYSQKSRSVIDKIIGYLLSPLLDAQYQTFGLSAGRIQSVALRLVYERELEIGKFESSGYYQVKGVFFKPDNKKILIGGDADKTFDNKDVVMVFLELGNKAVFKIVDVVTNTSKRNPPPPFITSSILQYCSTYMGLSPDKTNFALQKLFEAGHISYHRTDSVVLSADSKKEIKTVVDENFGEEHYSDNVYANKDDSQAAHEAIRPTHFELKQLNSSHGLSATENKIYNAIWKRAVASQMAAAEIEIKTIKIGMDNSERLFITKAEKILYKGYLALYEKEGSSKSNDTEEAEDAVGGEGDAAVVGDAEVVVDQTEIYEILNSLKIGDILKYKTLDATEKYSKPVARYTEASLIKELEKRSLGRPSTYSSLILKLLEPKKNYVKIMSKDAETVDSFILQYNNGKFTEKTVKVKLGGYKNKMVCLETGKVVAKFLSENFEKIMDYNFTSLMESKLDQIAEKKYKWFDVCKENYDSFAPQLDLVRSKQAAGEKGKVKKYLGMEPNNGSDVCIIYNKNGPSILTEINGEKKYCGITEEEALGMTLERSLELLKYPIILESPTKDPKETIQVCKGKNNYYLKSETGTVSLTDDSEEPPAMTWAIAKGVFDAGFQSKESKTLRTFEEDAKLTIINARYGPCILYSGKKTKLFVAIPKNKTAESLTFEDCVVLVNKKKEQQKKGIKPKPFRKFTKKEE
jgi:DNA topoisomerase-1